MPFDVQIVGRDQQQNRAVAGRLAGRLRRVADVRVQQPADLPRLEFAIDRIKALIYLLLVVNFQSWLDPFIILTVLPGALVGVVWGLYLTYTT